MSVRRRRRTNTSETFGHSAFESGTESQADSTGGPDINSDFSQHDDVASQATRVNRRPLKLGAAGAITGGTESTHLVQNDSSSRTLAASTDAKRAGGGAAVVARATRTR